MIAAIQVAQNLVRDHAKANHKAPPPEGSHPDERYYDRSGRLTNSIRADKVKAERGKIQADVLAGTPGLVEYAAAVEFGTSRSRAYPFLGPALSVNEKKIILILEAGVNKVLNI